jgi:hypothetical protein
MTSAAVSFPNLRRRGSRGPQHNLKQRAKRLISQEAGSHGNSTQEKLVEQQVEFLTRQIAFVVSEEERKQIVAFPSLLDLVEQEEQLQWLASQHITLEVLGQFVEEEVFE